MVSSCSGYDALGQERNIGKAVDIVQRIKSDISTRWMDKIKIQNLIPPVLQQRDEFVHDPALCNRTDDRARKGFQKEWFHDRNRFAGAAAAHDKDIVIQSGFPAVCTEDATIAQDHAVGPVRVLCRDVQRSGLTFCHCLDPPVLLKALQSPRMG